MTFKMPVGFNTRVTFSGSVAMMQEHKYSTEETRKVHSFLDDIVKHPEDSTPRCIFADFMEEHGDYRAQQMRDMIPRPADIYPRSFDSKRMGQIKPIKLNGPPNVVTPLYGCSSGGWYMGEMLVRKHPPEAQGLLYFDTIEGAFSRLPILVNGLQNIAGLQFNSIYVEPIEHTKGIIVDFQLRLFRNRVRCHTRSSGLVGLLTGLFWAQEYPIVPNSFYRVNDPKVDGFICYGTMRDPHTALLCNLLELLPEHNDFLDTL